METILLTRSQALEIVKINDTYPKAIKILNRESSKVPSNEITTKWQMEDGRTLVVSFSFPKNKAWLQAHCECEVPILLMNSEPFEPFDMVLDASTKDIKAVRLPKSHIARAFLDKEYHGRTNLNMLLALAIASYILVDTLWMLTIRHGDTIKPMPEFTKVAMTYINERLLFLRNKQMLDGWDTVSLTTKQVEKVSNILEKHQIDLDFFHYAIEKFCFINYDCDDKKNYYYFYTLEKGHLNCEFKAETSPVSIPFIATFKPQEMDDGKIGIDMMMHCDDEKHSEKLQNKLVDSDKTYWEWIVGMFFVINTLMLNYGDVSMEVEEKVATAPSKGKSNKKHDRSTSRLFKTYTLKKRWVSAVARKHAEITCPCWGVRGHFRHYKNGKVIYIEPHLKGKDKDQYKGKEYALMPYKEA